jgi:hypothetical protein
VNAGGLTGDGSALPISAASTRNNRARFEQIEATQAALEGRLDRAEAALAAPGE